MKVIAISDIHEHLDTIKLIYNDIKNADVLVISGDITIYGNSRSAVKVISNIRRINNNILAVIGNLDDESVLKYLESENISIHGRGCQIDNVGFFGVGGSNKTPFNTPTEYSEETIKEILSKGYEMVKDAEVKIMVTHMPPFNTKCDLTASGQHVGSTAVRKFITQNLPHINLTGHIHESKNVDTVGRTKIINTGLFEEGGYAYFDTSDSSGFFKNATLLNAHDQDQEQS